MFMKLSNLINAFFTSGLILVICCGTPVKKPETLIGPAINHTNNATRTPLIQDSLKNITPSTPNSAVMGNYNGDLIPFYADITKVDMKKGGTYISFQDTTLQQLLIPKTYGGTISSLVLDGFDRDLLLVTAKLKDKNFNKYFLYVLRDAQWKAVINGFAIHKSNNPETLQVIKVNSEKPKELLRHYSVFDIDENSDTGYQWLLKEESVPKMAW